MDVSLPVDKLTIGSQSKDKTCVVLVATGSFNPPTFMHFTHLFVSCLELARDALHSEGFHVLGGYMSPVNDAYKKEDCVGTYLQSIFFSRNKALCPYKAVKAYSTGIPRQLPTEFGGFIKGQDFPYKQSPCTQGNFQAKIYSVWFLMLESLKVMLLCGSDLLESFCSPGVWIPEQVRSICKDYGIVCIRREGQDVENMIFGDRILYETRDNIRIVNNFVSNQISSSRLR
uniref:Cytidyltransferase-like domain-containing protein n=1 Tax=Brassica oleracea TaxID=3712 RepID=A0A3P6A733_BRAOL|nr:unnamed protein product [Brassica oleracea]